MSKKTKFDRMTKPQQRVAIAKDVLKQIHAGRIKAKTMIYVRALNGGYRPKPGQPCKACALGALFVSKYALANGMWISDPGQEELHGSLALYFSKYQLKDIENAFEGHLWNHEHANDEDRMIAIMQNIVDHNGTFKKNVMYEMV